MYGLLPDQALMMTELLKDEFGECQTEKASLHKQLADEISRQLWQEMLSKNDVVVDKVREESIVAAGTCSCYTLLWLSWHLQ